MGKEQPVNPLICKEIRRICEEECGSMFLANFERKAMKKGIEMGIEESLTHVAKRMLEDNMDIDLIAKYTGLALEDIKKLIYEEKIRKEGIKKAQVEIAKKLLKRNISPEVISEVTDLSPEDINKLNMESKV